MDWWTCVLLLQVCLCLSVIALSASVLGLWAVVVTLNARASAPGAQRPVSRP